MIYNRVSLKEAAKAKIKGQIFNLLAADLILGAVGGIAGIPYLAIISTLLCVIAIGHAYFYLNYLNTGKCNYEDLFISFTSKDLNKYLTHLGTLLVSGLLIVLWTLLFIIPGIIKAMAYSQVTYIRAEKSELSIMDCLKESEKMMDGHKAEYFELMLSFIGWFILGAITCGILYIYVLPYFSTARAMYYQQLKASILPSDSISPQEPTIS